MFQTIPTYLVTLWTEPEEEPLLFRVPETHLEGFLHIVIFNHFETFKVTKESPHSHTITSQQISQIPGITP